MYSRGQRALNDAELRALRLAIATAKRERTTIRMRMLVIGPVVIGLFWMFTLLATRTILTPMLFWILIGTPMMIWAWAEADTPHRKRIAGCQDAMANGKVDETRISSTIMIEFREIEDEGACYAFQMEQNQIIFIRGQD